MAHTREMGGIFGPYWGYGRDMWPILGSWEGFVAHTGEMVGICGIYRGDGRYVWHILGRREGHTGFWWGT